MTAIPVAVVGATGLVGETMIKVLEERDFPVAAAAIRSRASARSARPCSFRGRRLPGAGSRTLRFQQGATSALFSAGRGSLARVRAEGARAAGCIVIDNTSEFRYRGRHSAGGAGGESARASRSTSTRGIIANPNCSTIQMLVALKPHPRCGRASSASTWRPISPSPAPGAKRWKSWRARPPRCLSGKGPIEGPGRSQADRLQLSCRRSMCSRTTATRKEEMKMVWETHKILEDPTIRVNATAVRVPVFFGHSEAVHIETRRKITCGRGARAAEKSAWRRGHGRARAGRVSHGCYRGSEPRHSLCRANP